VTPDTRTRVWRWARPWWSFAAGLVLYGVVRWAFAHAAGSQGLLTPGRPVDRGLVGLAIAALVLRGAVLVAVPAVIAYRIAAALLRWRVARSTPAPGPAPGPAPENTSPEQAEPPR
jgi:hypothetical protein